MELITVYVRRVEGGWDQLALAAAMGYDQEMGNLHNDPPLYYAACCQTSFECPRDRQGIPPLVDRMLAMATDAIVGHEPIHDVRLIVFPEFAHAAPIYDTVAKLKDRLSVELPNELTDRYVAVCKKYGCYIQTGSFIEFDPAWPDALFNTTLLLGPQGVLAKYRKVNPWIPWEVHTSPHDLPGYGEPLFPVADTEIGRLGTAICYDWLFPESIRQLAFNGAEVLVRVSAYMDPWGTMSPTEWWALINRTRAIENTAYVVACNQAAKRPQYPPFSWPGGSMVVDYDGRTLAVADPGPHEKIVVAPIDIARLRTERQRRRGHDMRAHLRTEAHPYLDDSIMPPAGRERITIESNELRIEQAKRIVSEHDRD